MKSVQRDLLVRMLAALVVVFGLVFSSMVAPTAKADELYGRMRGVVTDSSGAVLPGVQLNLTNRDTNTSSELVSDSDGAFAFINLKPGVYSLAATKANFKTFQVSSIRVEPNEIRVQNVVLELGSVSETIEVAANQVQVEQSSMQLTAKRSRTVSWSMGTTQTICR